MALGFENLEIWQEAHNLMLQIYKLTKGFPAEEKFGRVQQIRRSSGSIADNIAEGYGRFGLGDKVRFLRIARGSALETKNHLMASRDLEFMVKNDAQSLIEKYENLVKRINAYINYLQKKFSVKT